MYHRHCLPPETKCEWSILSHFVDFYNEKFKTQYKRKSCPDIFDKTRKQPEVILESENEKPMVIERKIIQWPKDAIKNHRSEHEFFDEFFGNLDLKSFEDALYILNISGDDIPEKYDTRKEFAKSISNVINHNILKIKNEGIIFGSEPIEWSFRIAEDYLKDERTPEHGVGVSISHSHGSSLWEELREELMEELFISPDFSDKSSKAKRELLPLPFSPDFPDKFSKAKKELHEQIEKALRNTEEKFKGYNEYIRLLVFEFYGDNTLFALSNFKEIISELNVPENINEIWMTDEDETIEDKVIYEKIYTNTKEVDFRF